MGINLLNYIHVYWKQAHLYQKSKQTIPHVNLIKMEDMHKNGDSKNNFYLKIKHVIRRNNDLNKLFIV